MPLFSVNVLLMKINMILEYKDENMYAQRDFKGKMTNFIILVLKYYYCNNNNVNNGLSYI